MSHLPQHEAGQPKTSGSLWRRAWAWVSAGLFAAVPVAWFYTFFLVEPLPGQPPLGKLKEEFFRVEPPSASQAVGEQVMRWKQGSALVLREYANTTDRESILHHYQQELLERGWAYRTTTRRIGGSSLIKYCKGQFLASVEIDDPGTAPLRSFAFAVSWSSESIRLCFRDNRPPARG